MKKEGSLVLETNVKNTWCPGCGNFGILRAFKKAVKMLEEENINPRKIVVVSGIGCHGKISDYLNLSSFHSIHGRVLPFLTGLKLANPELFAVGFSGDGDALNEGIAHLIHSARRNIDVTLFVHNNGVFGLTTGQATATSPHGFKSKSTPAGNPEFPLNSAALSLVSGATFVARAFSGDIDHLSHIMKEAIKHRGFSFVEILQPCVSFNDTWDYYRENIDRLDNYSRDEFNFEESLKLCYQENPILTGILYREEKETLDSVLKSVNAQDIHELIERIG